MRELNKGNLPSKTLRVSAHDLLVSTNRQTNGKGYSLLKKALARLRGVSLTTNIKTNKREITSAFGLIDSYEIVESSRVKDRMVRLEITLSDWFYNSLLGKEVLTIHRDYFRLGKPLERRLYEIARKHCGKNSEWKIGLANLQEKTGSVAPLAKFKFFIKQLEVSSHMPDYELCLTDNDIVIFNPIKKVVALTSLEGLAPIKKATISKGASIVLSAGTGWDYDTIRAEFTDQIMKGYSPDKIDGAFINFVKKKVLHRPE